MNGNIGFGTPAGTKLFTYFGPFQRNPSTCVNTTLKIARTNVTDSCDVTA